MKTLSKCQGGGKKQKAWTLQECPLLVLLLTFAHIQYQTSSCANKCYVFLHHCLIIAAAAVVWCVQQQSEAPILHFALLWSKKHIVNCLLCPWEHWVGDILSQVVAMLCEMATKILQNSSQNPPIFFAKQSSKEGQTKDLYLHYIKCGIVLPHKHWNLRGIRCNMQCTPSAIQLEIYISFWVLAQWLDQVAASCTLYQVPKP